MFLSRTVGDRPFLLLCIACFKKVSHEAGIARRRRMYAGVATHADELDRWGPPWSRTIPLIAATGSGKEWMSNTSAHRPPRLTRGVVRVPTRWPSKPASVFSCRRAPPTYSKTDPSCERRCDRAAGRRRGGRDGPSREVERSADPWSPARRQRSMVNCPTAAGFQG